MTRAVWQEGTRTYLYYTTFYLTQHIIAIIIAQLAFADGSVVDRGI